MKRVTNYLIILLLVLSINACHNDKSYDGSIGVNLNELSELMLFYDQIKEIRLIAIDPGYDNFFGSDPQVQYSGSEIFLIDKNGKGKIYRFSQEGELINTIGNRGRGPTEYIDIKNVQIINDTVIVVSSPFITVNKYLKDGSFIKSETFDIEAQQAVYSDNRLYAYSGFGMQQPFRFITVESGEICYLLSSEEKVLSFHEETDVFSLTDDKLFARETYSNTIMSINTDITPYLTFNFSKHKIPNEFFKFSNSFEAAEYLIKQEYAVIRKFYETNSFRIVEVLLLHKPLPSFIYGLNIKNRGETDWDWFSMGKIGKSPFTNSLKFTAGNKIIFLLDPLHINNLSEAELSKISNSDVLNKVTENSNYIIAEYILYE